MSFFFQPKVAILTQSHGQDQTAQGGMEAKNMYFSQEYSREMKIQNENFPLM